MARTYDAVVVGAGILGLSVARRLLLDRPHARVLVLDKEPRLAAHQTGRNSGVVHSGVYYAPGSLKARLCVEGKRLLEAYADERGIARATPGKVVVALDESELPRLAELERRARANGVEDLRVLDAAQLRTIEPNVRGVRALHAPHTGIVDYTRVAECFAEDVRALGGEIELGLEARRVLTNGTHAEVVTAGETLRARVAVACAGLQSDRLAGAARGDVRIVPFRGDYYTLTPEASRLVNGLVYPVPDPAFPFLGVHFTKRLDGSVIAGPNAVLALARERYRRTSFSVRDAAATLSYPAFWRLARRHLRTGAAEAWRDLSKRAFVRDMQRYLPSIGARDVSFGPSGIRAQALTADGRLADDFVIRGSGRAIHVVNAPSPAATSSLAIGAQIAALASAALD